MCQRRLGCRTIRHALCGLSSALNRDETERMARRNALTVLGALVLALALFVAGAFTAVVRGWGSPLVSVVVQNDATAEVRSVTLSVTSCGSTSKLAVAALAPSQRHTFRFPVCGEGGYELEAALADGRTLKSQAYVESGYSVSEHVEPSRIRSQARAFRL